MSFPSHFTDAEIIALLDSATILSHIVGGSVQIEKAGIIGTGSTISEAAADWGQKFALGIALPKDTI
jgi:hypothetical protein